MSTQDTGEALLHAAKNGNVDQAQTLLDNGTDPDIKDATESTPLHYAAKEGDLKIVELLLEYGADPNAKGFSKSTPLHYAAGDKRHSGIVQLLLDYWADPKVENGNGLTPLHIAVKGNKVLVVKLLLDSGANPQARDSGGKTPRRYITEVDIARLFEKETVAVFQQAQAAPVFPITINGNTLNQSIPPATGSLETEYILIQCWARLSPSDRQKLDDVGVKHLDYVSKNTYLCQYQDKDLKRICKLEPVVYVEIYRTELKITPSLRESIEAEPDRDYKVDIEFHEGVHPYSLNLQSDIAMKSRCSVIEFLPNKARLTIKEEVGEVVKCNDMARRLLKLDLQSPPCPTQQRGFLGSGQIIAIADTGFHEGENGKDHLAFNDRVRGWIAVNGSTKDSDGHGTHVCGSAVGDGETANGDRVMGTAPRAELIVQSIWDPNLVQPGLNPPSDLTKLFEEPYKKGAKLHSNSWGTNYVTRDSQGKTTMFRQMDYTTGAKEIDEFIYNHPEMVICFAAGNYGYCLVRHASDKGYIGAEAAAKNCITVGASLSSRDQGSNPDDVADFSSCGPTKSRRCKPDVVAPGTSILSTNSGLVQPPDNPSPDSNWCYMSGTSMATALVAGCAAVLREALVNLYPNSTPRFPTAALIKALLVNGADVLEPINGRFVPSHSSGFGRVNMANALKIVHCEPGTGFGELELDNNSLWGKVIDVESSYTTLKATIVWSDLPGAVVKNKLRLRLEHANGPQRFAVSNNTVQQVVWDNIPYGSLKFEVIGRLDRSPQPFAVAWRFV